VFSASLPNHFVNYTAMGKKALFPAFFVRGFGLGFGLFALPGPGPGLSGVAHPARIAAILPLPAGQRLPTLETKACSGLAAPVTNSPPTLPGRMIPEIVFSVQFPV